MHILWRVQHHRLEHSLGNLVIPTHSTDTGAGGSPARTENT